MSLRVFDDYVSRVGAGYWLRQPLWGEANANMTAQASSGTYTPNNQYCILGDTLALPSLPSGVTAYICTHADFLSSQSAPGWSVLLGKAISFGTFDISTGGSGGAGTFTDGATMPLQKELGVANVQTWSPIFYEVTTVLSATLGTTKVTYTDQSGNTGHQTTTIAFGASSPIRSAGVVPLNSPDIGAIDITAVARTGGTTPTGIIQFWGFLPICLMSPDTQNTGGGMPMTENLLGSAPNPLRLGAGDVIRPLFFNSSVARAVLGSLFFVGDS